MPRLLGICISLCAVSLLRAQFGLDPAKDKKDASLYLFGSALAGFGTKPVYILDAKVDWMVRKENMSSTRTPCSFHNQSVKLSGTFLANASAEAPVDRSDIDPDSITGGLLFDCQRPFDPAKFLAIPIFQEFRINGEFTRKFPVSNFVSSAVFRLAPRPARLPRGGVTFYPFAGFEAGHNLNKPALLFKRPVDLSTYNAIGRFVAGVRGGFYFFQPNPAEADYYRVVLDYSYTGRTLLASEPIVRARYVADAKGAISRQKVTEVDQSYRPSAEIGLTWAVSPLVGVKVQYRYGYLPPLYEFTNHQASIGLTFKGKQK